MVGRSYEPGNVAEGFADTHGFIGSQLPGFYKSEESASHGRGLMTNVVADAWAARPFRWRHVLS